MFNKTSISKLLLILIAGVVFASCGVESRGINENGAIENLDSSEFPNLNDAPVIEDGGNILNQSDDPALINIRIQDDREYNFPFLIPFDAIAPVYDPKFVRADQAPLIDEELVIGVAWGGKAKAYPITVLRFREMVIDELDGIPTLVTW